MVRVPEDFYSVRWREVGRLTLVEQALELEPGHEVLGGRHSGWWG